MGIKSFVNTDEASFLRHGFDTFANRWSHKKGDFLKSFFRLALPLHVAI